MSKLDKRSLIACKRCRSKKLKCDDSTPKTCQNCKKATVPCILVDPVSKREFDREYVESLGDRARSLRAALGESADSPTVSSNSVTQGTGPSTFHGAGSVISVAKLVEAAVSARAVASCLIDVGQEVAKEQQMLTGIKASRAPLPPSPAGHGLVESYLSGLHVLHPVLRRSTVYSDLESMYSQNTPPCSKEVLFRIYMVFAIGAIPLWRKGIHTVAPIDYYVTAMGHATPILGLPGFGQIQAIMLIILFSIQHDIGMGNKWDLTRMAMRICIENEYHLKARGRFDFMEEQMRRRLFWACYISDRHIASLTGRPVAIEDRDIDIELPIDADDDLIEAGNTGEQHARGYSEVSFQLRQISLRKITSRIRTQLYRAPSSSLTTEILAALDVWRDSFPHIPNSTNVYEAVEWRDLNYFRERLSTFRCLVTQPRACQEPSGAAGQFTDLCLEAATKVIQSYRNLHASEKLVLNWTCVHDVMSAGFTALFCGLAIYDSSGEERQSWEEHRNTMLLASSGCIDILSLIAETWTTVKKHLEIFKALSTKVSDIVQAPRSTLQTQNQATTLPSLSGSDQAAWDIPGSTSDWANPPNDVLNFSDSIDWSKVNWETIMNCEEPMLDLNDIYYRDL